MRVLVTGGAGFIGSHLCAALSARGDQTTALDAFRDPACSSHRDDQARALEYRRHALLTKTRVLHSDVANRSDLYAHVCESQPECIVHLAGVSSVSAAQEQPAAAATDIFQTTAALLEIIREVKFVRRFVYVSSSMVYGNFQSGMVSEETACRPINIYGGLKLSGEIITKAHLADTATDWVIIRPSAVYGPGEASRRVVQIFCEDGLHGRQVQITGGFGKLLDFTYVDDVVDGLCKVISTDRAARETFNLTFGHARSLGDLVKSIRHCYPALDISDAGANEDYQPQRGTLDISKARRLLRYEPKYDLERGVSLYIDWLMSMSAIPAAEAAAHD